MTEEEDRIRAKRFEEWAKNSGIAFYFARDGYEYIDRDTWKAARAFQAGADFARSERESGRREGLLERAKAICECQAEVERTFPPESED